MYICEMEILSNINGSLFLNGEVCTYETIEIRTYFENLLNEGETDILPNDYQYKIVLSSFYGKVALISKIKDNLTEYTYTVSGEDKQLLIYSLETAMATCDWDNYLKEEYHSPNDQIN